MSKMRENEEEKKKKVKENEKKTPNKITTL